ncbi:MAG TPA: hypothetical protein VEX18_15575 [Polyangiaceae bacterium]|nr:hypothetical protein [Polyangiaceae bacterium]
MLVKRLPLLLVFAGGCLSGAALIGFVRSEPDSARAPRPMDVSDRRALSFAPTAERMDRDDHEAANAAPEIAAASPKKIEPNGGEPPPESGTSLADVLAGLEATYRERLVASQVREPARPPAPEPVAPAVTAASVSPPVAAAAPVPAAVALVEPPAPPKSVPVPAAPAPSVESEAARVVASRDDARSRAVHVGDVNHVNIGSVHLGDVVQVQQLALLQYMQLLALTPRAHVAAPGAGIAPPVQAPRRQLPRRPPPFSTSLTDPNNPWGFDFPPTVLAK